MVDEICAKLAGLGLGTVGTDIFPDMFPDRPDECCVVMSLGGPRPDFGFGSAGVHFENPAFSVMFRGLPPGPSVTTSLSGPRGKAMQALAGLAAVEVTTLSSGVGGTQALYHFIHPLQSAPRPIGGSVQGQDDRKRAYFSIDFEAQKEPSVAA